MQTIGSSIICFNKCASRINMYYAASIYILLQFCFLTSLLLLSFGKHQYTIYDYNIASW